MQLINQHKCVSFFVFGSNKLSKWKLVDIAGMNSLDGRVV